MKVFRGFEALREIKKPVVTTGSFDGVHVGHKIIINRLKQLAREIEGESVLITFYPHPRKVLYPDSKGKDLLMINSQNEKIELLAETGLDNLIIVNFTREFASITSIQFIENYLLGKLHAEIIVVGFNHFFGKNREGDFTCLEKLSAKHGFRIEEIPQQDIQNEKVSSTRIRKALNKGDIQRANAYLDHLYIIKGEVLPGSGKMKNLGFNTIGLRLEEDIKLIPPDGVYAIKIEIDHTQLKGILNIRSRHFTGDETSARIELLLVEPFPNNKVATEAKIFLYKRFRDTREFSSDDQLKEQLENDISYIDELIY